MNALTRLLHRRAASAPLFHYGQLPFYWEVTTDVLDRLRGQLTRVVRSRGLVLDVDPDLATALGRFLLDQDRGACVRQQAGLRVALARHYAIDSEDSSQNLTWTVPQVLFSLLPR